MHSPYGENVIENGELAQIAMTMGLSAIFHSHLSVRLKYLDILLRIVVCNSVYVNPVTSFCFHQPTNSSLLQHAVENQRQDTSVKSLSM